MQVLPQDIFLLLLFNMGCRAHVQGLFITLVCVLLLPLLKHLFLKLQKHFLNLLLGLVKVCSSSMLELLPSNMFGLLFHVTYSV